MNVLISDVTLKAIADKVRSKLGVTTKYKMSQIPDAIDAIVAKIQSAFNLQSKTVNPTESEQVISPDDGYDALTSVTVGAIDKNYVGSGITRQGGSTITPTKSVQTAVASGKYTTGDVKVGIIPSEYIIPSGSETKNENGSYDVTNLKTLVVDVAQTGIDTSDANATELDIVYPKTAYVNGEKIAGQISDLRGETSTISYDHLHYSQQPWGGYDIIVYGHGDGGLRGEIINEETTTITTINPNEFGGASPSSVLQGETFTSSAGLKQEGTLVVNKYYERTSVPANSFGNNGDICLITG